MSRTVRRPGILFMTVFFLVFITVFTAAASIFDVPSEYPTIQAGIDAAGPVA